MYNEILVPTDGSAAADASVSHALELAQQFGARVHAMYVIDVALFASLEAGGDTILDALEREGETAVAAVADACSEAGVEAMTAVETGTVYRTILDYVDEHDIDLVVMGTHGRKGVERFLLGSVTERVVRGSGVPVLTVRAVDEGESSE